MGSFSDLKVGNVLNGFTTISLEMAVLTSDFRNISYRHVCTKCLVIFLRVIKAEWLAGGFYFPLLLWRLSRVDKPLLTSGPGPANFTKL